MAKNKSNSRPLGTGAWVFLAALVLAGATATVVLKQRARPVPTSTNAPARSGGANVSMTSTIEINHAVMVTVDLDFGGAPLPTLADALREIERRYEPLEGSGRTFAILDAYGHPTEEKKLRVSMHVSAEKVGAGSLVFRRTGRTLWRGQFTPLSANAKPPSTGGQNLMMFVDNGAGKMWTIDGSSNPLSVLEATVKEVGKPLKDLWPDGEDREFTFLYSTCGCPVKVMTRREGDRTKRTKDLPIIFPDDPTVVDVITSLMRWEK